MFEWVLGMIPWWIWAAVIVAAIVAVQMTFGWKVTTGALIAALPALGAIWGRQLGSEQERAKQDRETLDHVRIRKETDDGIDQIGHADVDERLARWNRDE
ncbi:hypothetical protein [Devosia alba]|uniref:hypothetical protein n=1 Tax=Devosia alba TaxID=3152360 RepID=UPI00326597B0